MIGIVVNELNEDSNPLLSASIEDFLLRNVKENMVILHLFQDEGINIGVQDQRHPQIEQGLNYFKKNNINVSLRQSGGQAIVADHGIINFSLTFISNRSSQENYDIFNRFVRNALANYLNIEFDFGLVKGAYCPGGSDMSYQGKKILGSAQKQVGNKTQINAYLAVDGDQDQRSELIRGFYQAMSDDMLILNDSMANLKDVSDKNFNIQDVSAMLITKLLNRTHAIHELSPSEIKKHPKFKKSYHITYQKHAKLKLGS